MCVLLMSIFPCINHHGVLVITSKTTANRLIMAMLIIPLTQKRLLAAPAMFLVVLVEETYH